MGTFTLLLEVLGTGLKIWENKQKDSLFKEWQEIKLELNELESAEYEKRDQNSIDKLHYRLMLLSFKFTLNASARPDSPPK